MRPVAEPDIWEKTLRSFQEATHRAELLSRSGNVDALPGFTGGSVTLDITAAVRGSCQLTFSDPTLIPTSPSDPLAPYGQEIRVWRGVFDAAGSGQEIAIGTFRIQDTDWDDSGDGLTINVNGFDRAQTVTEDTVVADGESLLQIPAGADYIQTIKNFLTHGLLPGHTFAFVGEGWDITAVGGTPLVTTPIPLNEGDDRWGAAQDMAAVIGCDLYFDGDGNAAMTKIPDPVTATPDAELVEGDGGLLVSASANWSREDSPNRVIYTGENTANGDVYRYDKKDDDDPDSPTNYDNNVYGHVHSFKQSDKIGSNEQAQEAAIGELNRVKGVQKSINFGTIVNPALEPSDVILVRRDRSGIADELHIIDSLTIPLDVQQPMTGQTRAVRIK